MDFNDVMVAFNAILRSFNMEMDMWHAQQNQHVLAFQNGHSQRLSRDQLEFLKSLCSRYMPSQIIRECPPPPMQGGYLDGKLCPILHLACPLHQLFFLQIYQDGSLFSYWFFTKYIFPKLVKGMPNILEDVTVFVLDICIKGMISSKVHPKLFFVDLFR